MTGSKNPMYRVIGERHPKWVGDAVQYNALHSWVKRRLGRPDTCEHCNKKGKHITYLKQGKPNKKWSIQWANKSGKYKRDTEDWLKLCAKCHYSFDRLK